ncbi:hypothetical protein [Tardiphaga sp.]|nr:hypothetical protein [Tardiphaga sp.]
MPAHAWARGNRASRNAVQSDAYRAVFTPKGFTPKSFTSKSWA